MSAIRQLLHTLLGVCVLFLVSSVSASTAAPLILTASEGHVPVAGHLEVLKDETGTMTIQEVTSPLQSIRFKEIPNNLTAGFLQNGAIWLRFTVKRSTAAPPEWLLELEPASIERLELYLPSSSGGFETRYGGLLIPFSKREFPYRTDLFRLNLPAGQTETIHVRIASKRTIIVNPVLWQPDAFRQAAIVRALTHGAYLGIIILFAGITLLYWLRLREPLYGYYAAYLVGLGCMFITC